MLLLLFHDHDEGEGMECVGCFWHWLFPILVLVVIGLASWGLVKLVPPL